MIRAQESVGVEWRAEEIRVARLARRWGRFYWREALVLPREGDLPLGERALAALGAQSGPVVLGLPGRQGVLHRVVLPAADRALLRQLLEFDLERHLPLAPEKVYFDFAVLGRPGRRRWDVLLGATPKHVVDAAVESLALGSWPLRATLAPLATLTAAALAGARSGPGLVVELDRGTLRGEVLDVGRSLWRDARPVADDSDDARAAGVRALGEAARAAGPLAWTLWAGEGESAPLETWARQVGLPCLDPLARLRGRPRQADRRFVTAVGLALQGLPWGPWRLDVLNPTLPTSRRVLWARTAAVAGLLAAGLATGLWLNQYRLDRRALTRTLARIQRLTPEVRGLEREAEQAAQLRRVVEPLERVAREPSKLGLLQELTAVTPHHTWVTRLMYKRDEIELSGYSSSAQELIPRLEASPRFQQAGFVGSIEREGSQERFTIRARLR